MKILVTGTTGFIGTALVSAVISIGHQVTIVVRKVSVILPTFVVQVDWSDFSKFDRSVFEGVDVVIRCAGRAHFLNNVAVGLLSEFRVAVLESQSRGAARTLALVKDYETTNVSDKLLRIILSYTDFVNRKVWHKS